ncbi:RnfABCDGE type electron transport complex subunit D [Planctomycetota bacterium]
MLRDIVVTPSPHISKPMSTRSVMLDVAIGLAPAVLVAAYYFRSRAVAVIATCVVACMVSEWLCNVLRRLPQPHASLGDLSALVTGIILALSLPPAIPMWAAVVGSVVSIAIGKMVFGGLGSNVFNPAMVGRTFMAASFGALMTTWSVPATIPADSYTIKADNLIEARTQATPLGWSKQAWKTRAKDTEASKQYAAHVNDNIKAAVLGEVGGCLGETSALALLIGGIYLLIRKTISFHLPLAVLLAAFIFSGIVHIARPESTLTPMAHVSSGALLLGAFFIATDPVTAPLTRRGMWLFGAGIGAVTILIRVFGEYPEGFMYAVLLMNALTPLIDRLFKRVPTGGKPNV